MKEYTKEEVILFIGTKLLKSIDLDNYFDMNDYCINTDGDLIMAETAIRYGYIFLYNASTHNCPYPYAFTPKAIKLFEGFLHL